MMLLFQRPRFKASRLFFCGILTPLYLTQAHAEMNFEQAFAFALKNDPWLASNELDEQSLRASSEAAKYLQDPLFSLGFVNLPTDGFALDQEPMTQLRVGVSQQLARGDSLRLRKQQLMQKANVNPHRRDDHRAKLRVLMSTFWLDVLKSNEMISLIRNERGFIENTVDIVEANYTSARDRTRQQDILSTQVELARLEDKLLQIESVKDVAISGLLEWVPHHIVTDAFDTSNTEMASLMPRPLPREITTLLEQKNWQNLAHQLSSHPLLLAMDESIKADNSAVDLAKQKYKPQWGVNASYAVRDDEPSGRSRADFFTIGVTLDLSLTGYERQDNEVRASHLKAESTRTDKRVTIQSMMSQLDSFYRKGQRYDQRLTVYSVDILPKIREQADASLTAYTNDDGTFVSAIRARIDLLNAQVEMIELETKQAKNDIQMAYFFSDYSSTLDQGSFK